MVWLSFNSALVHHRAFHKVQFHIHDDPHCTLSRSSHSHPTWFSLWNNRWIKSQCRHVYGDTCWTVAHSHTQRERREKTSECPFNLQRALWGFSRESACGMRRLYARDCSRWEQEDSGQRHQECGLPSFSHAQWEKLFISLLAGLPSPLKCSRACEAVCLSLLLQKG